MARRAAARKSPKSRTSGRTESVDPQQGRDMPWLQAIETVLRSAGRAMSPPEIADEVVESGLRQSVGATPAQTVWANLGVSLKKPKSPFIRAARGLYALRAQPSSATRKQEAQEASAQGEETGALGAFGMFWDRNAVIWSGTSARLLGRQGAGAAAVRPVDVNFSDQVGVYLLHDRERVIYVGRATTSLFSRLKSHTVDRLRTRWDRFSWFGLRAAKEDGSLKDIAVRWTPEVVFETMEAVLIEAMEPPLNRKRGDNLDSIEYIQIPDPTTFLRDLQEKIREMDNSK